MIPIRLELKNFMSYGEENTCLDFKGIHLACLSGENGNGKSALLDAITWALWGEARASADELIRLGTDEMRVQFDFELTGDLYRVIRARSKRNSGNLWEVYISDGPESFRPITGQGIRDTGRLIQRILRMDYKTFVNSAYIQQGRADEFTKQTVLDRKKILADILDLSRYDILEQRAKERRNEAEQKVQELGREIDQVEIELANEDGYQTQLTESKTQREALEANIAESEAKLRDLQARQAELDTTVRRVKELQQSISSGRAEIVNLQSQKAEQERRVVRSREILKDKERILAGQEKLRSTRELIVQLDRRLEELNAIEREKAGLDNQILMETHKLDIDKKTLSKELSELEAKIAGAACIEKEVPALTAQAAELDKLAARRLELEAEVAAQSDKWGALKNQHDNLKALKPDLEEKLKMISEPGAPCPLCRTELTHERYRSVVDDYNRQIAEIDIKLLDARKEGADAKSKRDSAQKEIADIDERLKSGMALRDRLAQAKNVILNVEEYRKQVPTLQEKLSVVDARLQSNDYALDARTKLAVALAKITALNYDADEHRRMKEGLPKLAEFDSLAVGLKHAEESLPSDEANLRTVGELIAAREKSIAENEQAVVELNKSLEGLPAILGELSIFSSGLVTLRESDRQVTGRIATLEQALEKCKALRKEMAGKRKELEKAKQDKTVYAELVAAFGKKGVQALIIENAIPEIQDEANNLLSRMTDNAMQVSIETVRDKKTGGTAETLDIKISDDMGTRSYELFSGGEAFRVNFALRIALSKLLARRAGARLQTLIIDEGFGTQDGKGREKLVEAIYSIKDDFELVLVITHIDELKDAFPTRIEITKDSTGSQISVN